MHEKGAALSVVPGYRGPRRGSEVFLATKPEGFRGLIDPAMIGFEEGRAHELYPILPPTTIAGDARGDSKVEH